MQHPPRALYRAFGQLAAGLLAACLIAAAPLAAQTKAQPKEITLNFKDADIRQIIEAVAEATGKNFIVDSRVKGPVTLISRTPLDAETVYEVFLNVLQVNGFIAVPSGNVIKILPDTNARQVPSKDLPGAGSLSSSSDEIVTQVIEVRNVGAAQLVPILRPLVPQYGHLAAHPASNTLIISDREANVYRMLRIIARIDQASDDDIEVITLEHASAGDLVRVLTALSQAGARGGEGAPTPSTLVADERTNSVLLGGEKNERLRFRTLIAHLDTPLEEGGDTQVIYLRYADAEELATKLKEQITGVEQSQVAGAQGGAAPPPAQQGTAVIWADAPTNSLVMTAPPKIMRNLRAVIDKLDIRRAQVKLEAFIAEISLEKSIELGVQFAVDGTDNAASAALTNFTTGGLGLLDLAAVAAGDASPESINIIPDGLTAGIGKIRDDSTSFAVLVSALRGDGTTNILSIPTVVTMDNEEAQLSVGQQVPFLTGSFASTGATGGGVSGEVNPFQTIQRQDVGLTLKVTPQINEGSAVVLEINLEVSSLAQGSSGAVDLITNRRTISQKVVVEDGGVVVLGGLIDDRLDEGEQRVPGLGAIPFVGNLFKARNTNKTKNNLMVFIQPKILRDGLQAAYETNTKYEYIRNLQLGGNKDVQLMRDEVRPVMPPLEGVQHPDLINPPAPVLAPAVPWTPPQDDLWNPGAGSQDSVPQTPTEEPEDGG